MRALHPITSWPSLAIFRHAMCKHTGHSHRLSNFLKSTMESPILHVLSELRILLCKEIVPWFMWYLKFCKANAFYAWLYKIHLIVHLYTVFMKLSATATRFKDKKFCLAFHLYTMHPCNILAKSSEMWPQCMVLNTPSIAMGCQPTQKHNKSTLIMDASIL